MWMLTQYVHGGTSPSLLSSFMLFTLLVPLDAIKRETDGDGGGGPFTDAMVSAIMSDVVAGLTVRFVSLSSSLNLRLCTRKR